MTVKEWQLRADTVHPSIECDVNPSAGFVTDNTIPKIQKVGFLFLVDETSMDVLRWTPHDHVCSPLEPFPPFCSK